MASHPESIGRFADLRLLHSGETTFGFVGKELGTGRGVFVKVLRQDCQEAHAHAALQQEAEVLASIERAYPALIAPSLLESGKWNGLPYLATELMHGISLAEAMRGRPRLRGAALSDFVRALLDALKHLHGAGWVHGDLSPENIFLRTSRTIVEGSFPENYTVVFVDFGSASQVGRSTEQVSDRVIVLKPSYTAPEISIGEAHTVKSDLFAAGVISYELAMGHRPWNARSLNEIPSLVRRGASSLWNETGVPASIALLVSRLLQRDQIHQPSSADECLSLLDATYRSMKDPARGAPSLPEPTLPAKPTATPDLSGSLPNLLEILKARFSVRKRSDGTVVSPRQKSDSSDRATADDGTAAGPEEHGLDTDALDRPMEISLAHRIPVLRPGRLAPIRLDFSVFAPSAVAPGTRFVIELWAYTRAQRNSVLEIATRAERMLERGSRGPVRVGKGTPISVLIDLPGFDLPENSDSFLWTGESTNVPFIVCAPEALSPGVHPGQVKILQGGLLISRVVFDVLIQEHPVTKELRSTHSAPIRTAFASYASEDRTEVLARAQALEAAGVDVFLDVVRLRTGKRWEPILLENIRTRDIFFLFWSAAARSSQWVEREWRLALDERGLGYIHPIPLVDPRQVPPPLELQALHFDDLYLTFLRAEEHSGEQLS